jgi:hypothetical protein
MGILSGAWGLVKKVFGAVLSIFPGPRQVAKLKPAVPGLIFAAVVICLGFINYALDLDRIVQAPFPILRKLWLPILFVLIWVLCWLAWWLWQLLSTEDEGALFPDIEAAWNEGLAMLKEAGIGISEAPLFLLLGRPLQEDALIFETLNYHLMVNQGVKNPRAPIQVFANRNGIYIACPGASLLSRESELLAAEMTKTTTTGAAAPAPMAARARTTVSDVPGELAELLGVSEVPKTPPTESTTAPANATATTVASPTAPQKRKLMRKQSHILFQQQQVEQLSARLQYLCRLIARERKPYCPVNGVLLLIPMSATTDDDDARQCGAICRRDLTTIRESLQVRCPFFTVITGLDELPGFKEFSQRIPTELTRQRLGQDFPLMPDLEPDGEKKMIESAVHWICRGLVTRAVYRLFQLPSLDANGADIHETNAKLFEFMHAIREREKRIGLIVSRAIMLDSPALFGGCYLASINTAMDPPGCFIGGCFGQLLENQNYVSWTNQAIREEAETGRITRYGYTVTFALIVIAVLLGAAYWPKL